MRNSTTAYVNLRPNRFVLAEVGGLKSVFWKRLMYKNKYKYNYIYLKRVNWFFNKF